MVAGGPFPADLFAPSDLVRASPASAVRVAGRVLEVHGDAVVLADALASIRVQLAAASPPVEPGDLAAFAGALRDGVLEGAVLAERIAPRRPPVGRAPAADPPSSETERLVHRGVGPALARRAGALAAIRALFAARGFLEVETPALVPSPGLDLHLDAFAALDAPLAASFLITSPEYQMKRLLAGGVPRCFQLARCFRRGEHGARHNPEFTMLEWYRAFAGVDEVMADTEAVVRGVAAALGAGGALRVGGAEVSLEGPFDRISVGEAFAQHAGVPADEAIALASADEDRFFRILVDEVEPRLARAPRPVFLVDYPAPFASLARLKPGDPRVCERFELYAGGVELCNGFGELTDPAEQRARLERDRAERARLGKPAYPIDERFLAALEEGMPPSAGNALGVDRLIALCLGAPAIADVLAFPLGWL